MISSVFVLLTVFHSPHITAEDTVSAAIEQAQGLARKRDRQGAAKVLLQAIEDTPAPLRARGKLLDSLAGICGMFFTDKGQRLFESAQSTFFENPDLALAQFKEALALEDGNIQILNNIARLQISKQDCEGALATTGKARELTPYLAEPALLELRALVCLKNHEEFREKLKLIPALDKSQDSYAQYLGGLDFIQQKQWRKAYDVLIKASEEEPRFPEAYYFLVKAGRELSLNVDGLARKYASLCKVISLRDRKHYSLEPHLCAFAKEMEDELEKKTTDM